MGVLVVNAGRTPGLVRVDGRVTRWQASDSEIFLDDVTCRAPCRVPARDRPLRRGGCRLPERHLRQPGAYRDRHFEGGDEVQIGKFKLVFLSRAQAEAPVGSAPTLQLASPCLLREEFPDITISKIRFLEAEACLSPSARRPATASSMARRGTPR